VNASQLQRAANRPAYRPETDFATSLS